MAKTLQKSNQQLEDNFDARITTIPIFRFLQEQTFSLNTNEQVYRNSRLARSVRKWRIFSNVFFDEESTLQINITFHTISGEAYWRIHQRCEQSTWFSECFFEIKALLLHIGFD